MILPTSLENEGPCGYTPDVPGSVPAESTTGEKLIWAGSCSEGHADIEIISLRTRVKINLLELNVTFDGFLLVKSLFREQMMSTLEKVG